MNTTHVDRKEREAADRVIGRQIAASGRIPMPGSSAAVREGWHNYQREMKSIRRPS
jgi:hypothetical protein